MISNPEEIQARLDAATKGPWEFTPCDSMPVLHIFAPDNKHIWHKDRELEEQEANAALIAHAPTDLTTLLQDLRDAREEISSLREAAARAKKAADAILAPVTMELGRVLYDAPEENLVPLMIEYGVELSAGKFMALYEATEERQCTCHPADNPPHPCSQKYALQACREAENTRPIGAPPREATEDNGVLTKRHIPHDEAKAAAIRLINSHFRNPDHARVSIPAKPDYDDDLVLLAYIRQQAMYDASPRQPRTEQEMRDGFSGLTVIADIIQHWLDYDVAQRTKEGLSTNDDTHLIAPPTWPSHGQLKYWVECLRSAETPRPSGVGGVELRTALGQLASAAATVMQSNQNGNEPDFAPLMNAYQRATKLLATASPSAPTTGEGD